MPRVRYAKLETPTQRRRLAVRKKPVYVRVAPGISLGYRRNESAGTWSVRVAQDGAEWLKKIGIADDFEPENLPHVLGYYAAVDAARKRARHDHGDGSRNEGAPICVSDAVDLYKASLTAKGGSVYNAARLRLHLTASLSQKPVGLLSATELTRWCAGLVENGLTPATANRLRTCLRAALTLAAKKDRRISNRHVWEDELPPLDDAKAARNVVLPDKVVAQFVAAAYQQDAGLGLLVHVMAETGSRPSQIVRLEVDDLDVAGSRLLMPRSGKGNPSQRARKMREKIAAPITPGLAQRLAQASRGRGRHERLLIRSNGRSWSDNPSNDYHDAVAAVIAGIGLDPKLVTPYSLRHSFATRSLLAGTPSAVVAHLMDTSESVIRRHYGKLLASHADAVARKGLLPDIEIEPQTSANVVALR